MSIRLVKCLPKVGFKNDFLHVSFLQYFHALLKITDKKCLRKPCLPLDRVWQNSSFLPNLFCIASNQYVNEVSVVRQHDIESVRPGARFFKQKSSLSLKLSHLMDVRASETWSYFFNTDKNLKTLLRIGRTKRVSGGFRSSKFQNFLR